MINKLGEARGVRYKYWEANIGFIGYTTRCKELIKSVTVEGRIEEYR